MALTSRSWRARRRARREARYSGPLETRRAWAAAWLDMFFTDHGVFRCLYLNLHKVGENAWRSAQPAPHHLRRYKRVGVRTIVNLRGGWEFGSWPLERDAAAAVGLTIAHCRLRSRDLPSVEEIRAFKALLDDLDYPILFHCKSGADRAGFASALYLALKEGRPVAEARKQLSLRYGHFASSRTGVLDAFFDAYQRDCAETGEDLMTWVETRYDPEAITDAFRAKPAASALVDWVLRRE